MSNQTIPQRIIRRQGEKELGYYSEPTNMPAESEAFRRAGLRRIAKQAGVGALLLTGAVATYVSADYALDHAETINRDFNDEHQRNFPNDPDFTPSTGADSHSAEQLDPVTMPNVTAGNAQTYVVPQEKM